MSSSYDDIVANLQKSYDGDVERRDHDGKAQWKLAERAAFLDRLRAAGARRLLELGAGTGQDGRYFADAGLDVVATDVSPAMVEACRRKGLAASVMDVLHLDFPPESFDAIHAMNCLLHVPNADLPAALANLRQVLAPDGLFFLGVYGGDGFEGVAPDDHHDPPRFFSWRTDEQIQRFARRSFAIEDFHVVSDSDAGGAGLAFQSLTLRRTDPM